MSDDLMTYEECEAWCQAHRVMLRCGCGFVVAAFSFSGSLEATGSGMRDAVTKFRNQVNPPAKPALFDEVKPGERVVWTYCGHDVHGRVDAVTEGHEGRRTVRLMQRAGAANVLYYGSFPAADNVRYAKPEETT